MSDRDKEPEKGLAPIISTRKLIRAGSAIQISIPLEWFRAHNLDYQKLDSLLMIANKDIRLVNPSHEKEIYEEVTKIVKKAQTV